MERHPGREAPTPEWATRPAIRILLADDHAMLRDGTRRVLEDQPGLCVVAEAADGPQAVAEARRTHPDVVVLDIGMPGGGIQASREILRLVPGARVLILSALDQRAYVRALQRQGIAGYLLKSARVERLVEAIRRVHRGETVFDPTVAGHLAAPAPDESAPTPRELDVLRAMAGGGSNREIAEALVLSENTVEFHLRNLYRKLDASSRADAIVNAQRMGWLDSPEPLC